LVRCERIITLNQEDSYEGFRNISRIKEYCAKKKINYFLNRVAQLYSFCQSDIVTAVESEQITQYLRQLSKNREDWQVQQASDAIKETYRTFDTKSGKQSRIFQALSNVLRD